MSKSPPPALVVSMVAVCFAIGVFSVLSSATRRSQQSAEDQGEPLVTALPFEILSSQTTVLLIGVDDLQSSKPALRAVWFLSFRPPATDIFFLGLPLDHPVEADPGDRLETTFAWQKPSGLPLAFREALFAIVPIEPDVTVVLDETSFARLIDYAGGVYMNGTLWDGKEVVGVLNWLQEDSGGLLTLQAKLIEALGERADGRGSTPDLTELTDLMPEHIFLTSSPEQLAGLLSPLLPVEPERIYVQIVESP